MRFILIILTLLLINCTYNGQNDEMNTRYPISIVYFDSLSQKKIGDFPINRKYYAELIDVIEEQKPKYIILKFFFADKTENDTRLIDILHKYDNVLTQAAVLSSNRSCNPEVLKNYRITHNNYRFPDYNNAWLPYPELGNQFSGIGFVNILAEGNTFKEFSLFNSLNGDIYPSLPLLILQREIEKDILIEQNKLSIGPVNIPVNSKGSFSVRLSQPNMLFKSYSFINVLNNKVDSKAFDNSIVIIFINGDKAPQFITGSTEPRNVAEILADAINTVLLFLD